MDDSGDNMLPLSSDLSNACKSTCGLAVADTVQVGDAVVGIVVLGAEEGVDAEVVMTVEELDVGVGDAAVPVVAAAAAFLNDKAAFAGECSLLPSALACGDGERRAAASKSGSDLLCCTADIICERR